MSEYWDAQLKAAGWEPGDIYDPSLMPERAGRRTKNLRLILMNTGRWSKRLVAGITEGHILSRYRSRKVKP